MKYSLFIILSASIILLIQCSNNIEPEKNYDIEDIISRIQINEREHGYNSFNTTIIKDSDSLNNFIKVVQNQNYWNYKDNFIKNISDTTMDFTEMNLLLFRHTEGSGSIELTLERPYILNGLITIKINRSSPSVTSDDMAYYCFAYLIKNDIDVVEFDIENSGREKIIIQ